MEIVFSTSWLHACLSLNKQEYHVLLKDTSFPPFTFIPLYFFTHISALNFEGTNCHFTLRSKVSRIRTKARGETLMHIVSLIMPCNCTLIWSPDMCFKWSRDSGRNHLTSKALGHHFLSTLSAHTWKSYLYNSPVAKALTREVGAQGSDPEPPYSEETVRLTVLLKHLE